MKRWHVTTGLAITTLAACGLLAAASRAAAQEKPKPAETAKSDEKLPKAEDIIAKSIEAMGGKTAMEKVRTRVLTGALEFQPLGIKCTFTAYTAAPNKSYEAVEIEGAGKEEAGSDGDVYWTISTAMGPRLLEGEEKETKARETGFNAELQWRKLYAKTECTETADVDDHPCYKVVFTPATGAPVTTYYDKKSYLPVKQETTVSGPMGKMALTTLLEDYQKSDAVLIARRMTTLVAGAPVKQIIVIEKIEQNTDIPADRFAPPEPVKALLAKSKAETKPAAGEKEKKAESKP